MKRAMAGEYSRELSTKVFAGQCRLIREGYRQGGPAGYGLRRQLVGESGAFKALLTAGEHKSLQTDRVILVPGPEDELRVVTRMYRMFVEERRGEREIACILNAEGRRTDLGRLWSRGTVHQVLTNEKYAGNNVFNRVSFKLKQKRVVNPPEALVRREGAFKAVVESGLFQATQAIIAERSRRFSEADMLDALRGLLSETGWLSGLVIDERDEMPSSGAYRRRFGSLLRAYALIGYATGRDYRYLETNRFLRTLHADVVAEVITAIESGSGAVARDPVSDLLTFNGEFTASLAVSRCLTLPSGTSRWKVRIDAGLRPDITVVIRMRPGNEQVQDYYLLPWIDLGEASLRMADENGLHLDAYRFDTLHGFFGLTERVGIRRAA